jgi:hypothetical protein
MRDDNLRPMWSETELDAALAALRSDVDTKEDALATGRAELIAAAVGPTERENPMTATITPVTREAEQPRTPRRGRLVAVAATIVALAAGGILVPTMRFGDGPPAATAAAAELNAAADKVATADEPLADGQFRYRRTHTAGHLTEMVVDGEDTAGVRTPFDEVRETWQPADPGQDWLVRSDEDPNTDLLAPCGRGPEAGKPDVDPCMSPGGWSSPTPEFIADLPTDPRQLLERLRADHQQADEDTHGTELSILNSLAEGLNTGLYPAEVRANLYRAIALIPGLTVTEGVANLDGQVGTAYGLGNEHVREELIIDPATGEFIGSRSESGGEGDEPASQSAVVIGVTDEPGVVPTR